MDDSLNKKKFIALTILIFFVALFFRTWKLDAFPVSLSIDEVAIGYNAYSILKTGKDEWSEKFPLAFKSVGDYKPPVNIYLTVPFIAVLGLNEWAVRLPSALTGTLTVLVFIFLLRELGIGRVGSLFGGFWLAILPWHVHFSRGSFEAVTALFFLILGTYLYFLSMRRNLLWITLSLIAFSLSIWAYHAERFFTPLLVIFLLALFRNELIPYFKKNLKLLILLIIIFLFFAVPFIYLTVFTDSIKTRALSTSILREPSLIFNLHNGNYSNFGELLFDNDYWLIFRHWAGKYINYFDFRFWFWKGMQFTPPGYSDLGLLYTVDLPIFLLGVYALIKSKNRILKKVAIFFFFAGPLAASFTMNEQHPLRAMVWIPFFGIVIASGFSWVLTRPKLFKIIVGALYSVAIFFSILYFKDIYFYQFPKFYSEYWQYGFKEISNYACQNKDKYKNVIISETFGSEGPLTTGTPYVYYLFYCKFDPETFINNKLLTKSNDAGNVIFNRVDWSSDSRRDNILLIAAPWDLPPDKIPKENIIKTINFLNGKTGFLFVETKPKL